ncbi:MAG: glycosyltransferase family 4 protein [Firmicutes bacterium]|nr:glycosyltransferase family 4 protein [Bacillota bacterium]
MKSLKVLLQNRSNCWKSIAGDSIQLFKTKEYLSRLGVQTEISSEDTLNLDSYDLIHLFNLMPVEETYRQFLNVRKHGKKFLLSTIYWDPTEFLTVSGQSGTFGIWWQRTMPLRRELLKEAALILPNSAMELAIIERDFGEKFQARIIPNAADPLFAEAKPDRFLSRCRTKDFLLSVGRICRRKNQLMLIRAAATLKLPLVLIGPVNDGIYYRQCRREAAGHKITFLDALTPSELASAYAAARVHALVSWYDTPGLASLEAALAGCNIVSSDRGSAGEYFGEHAFYCDPGDIDSVCRAIKAAWNAPRSDRLRQIIAAEYTWEKAALKTFQAYRDVLNASN